MTTLSAKADSFSGHACGNPLRSVPKAESPPEMQDVQRGVHVPVRGVPARAAMHPIRERLLRLRQRSASRTDLRCVFGIDCDNSHASVLCFACEDVEELRPTRVVRGLRQPGSGDTLDVQGFVGDEAVGIHQLPGFLVVEVPPLVGRLLVQLRNAVAGLAASGRTLPLACKRTLRPSESLLRLAVVMRGFYRRARRSDEERLQSEVYPNRRAVPDGFGRISEVAREDHVPLAARPLDGDGLDRPLDSPMQLDLDVSDVLEVQTPVVLQAATVPVGRELDTTEPVFRLVSRVARSAPGLAPAEERLERLVQSAQRSLRRREVEGCEARRGLARRLEPPRLFAVGDRTLFGLVHVPSFPKGKVVEPSVLSEHRVKGKLLRAVGEEPELVRPSHRLRPPPLFLSGDVTGYRLVRHVTRRTHVVTATPEARHTAPERPVALPKDARGVALELVSELGRGEDRRGLDEQMHMIRLDRKVFDLNLKLFGLLPNKGLQFVGNTAGQHGEPILRTPNKVIVEVRYTGRCMPILHAVSIQEKLDIDNLSNRRVVSAGLPLSHKYDSPRPAFSMGRCKKQSLKITSRE